jgi:SpoVK/Ycf46/Vps4 family AAA+-type ATPase
LDGVSGHLANAQVIVIGATNRPQEIDEAARRRFVKRYLIMIRATPGKKMLIRIYIDFIFPFQMRRLVLYWCRGS